MGQDFFLVFSPEREDPGNPTFQVNTIPKVVGGMTPACLEHGVALYSQVIDRVIAGVLHPGGGDEQAPGEHLPGGEHRPGQ